jgi:uncharacterized membrane protein HdeD (DUF308 family)
MIEMKECERQIQTTEKGIMALEDSGAVLLRREIDNEWTMALSGALCVLLGIVLFVLPGAGLLSLSWLIGIFALGAGITLIVLALRVRGQGPSGPSGSSTTT